MAQAFIIVDMKFLVHWIALLSRISNCDNRYGIALVGPAPVTDLIAVSVEAAWHFFRVLRVGVLEPAHKENYSQMV